DSALTTTLSATDIACHGELSGSLEAIVSGGAAPYTYDWRGPDSTMYNTPDITGVGAGNYELVVTDANQCVNTLTINITQPDSALAVNYSLLDHNGYNTSCADASDGAIDLEVI